jgi:endonuclease G
MMPRKFFTTLLAGALFLAGLIVAHAAALNCPDCDVTDVERARYDRALTLTAAQQQTAQSKHLLYGLPLPPASATREHLLHQKDYLTWYDDDLRVPLWVAYKITKANVTRVRERTECFRADPRLPADTRAECYDYDEATYDQGHLAPNADFKGSEAMMVNTYPYSNMTPQHDTFNRFTWERLEERVRMWTQARGDLFVVTGAVFDWDENGQRDPDAMARRVAPSNRVAIPSHFYKIITKKKTFGANDTIAILLPHDDVKHTGQAWEPWITQHLTTIGEIQRRTGIDFLPGITGTKRAEIENFKATALWPKE